MVTGKREYSDFLPRWEWMEDDVCTMLKIEVTGFRKEQLKVQLDNTGIIKVTGERPLTDSAGKNRWSRFSKDFRLPPGCSSSGIRAKFDNGSLYILMLKLPFPLLTSQSEPTGTSSSDADSGSSNGVAVEQPGWARRGTYDEEEEDLFSARRWKYKDDWAYNEDSVFLSGQRRSMKGTVIRTMLALLVLAGVGIALYFHYRVAKEAASPAIRANAGAPTQAE